MGVLWKALVLVHFFKLAGKTVNNDAIDPVLKVTLILKCRLEVPLLFLTSSNIIFVRSLDLFGFSHIMGD